jgi:2-iminoacetate synthase
MTTFADHLKNRSCAMSRLLQQFAERIEPKSDSELETLARQAQQLTRRYFGKTMRLFAPLYLSNECVNNCQYCGFSRDNPILRRTLSLEEVKREATHLASLGFRNLLLVSGEHPKFVSNGYLQSVLETLAPLIPSLSLEIAPLETEDYQPLCAAGAEGLVVYQETYHPDVYAQLHTAGPKKDFDWRVECPERAYAAGFRRIGIGALFGLVEWREEAMKLAEHVEYLLRRCWRAQLTVSLPRLRPAAGGFVPRYSLNDRDFVQLLCAFRVTFPQIGLVLSTREPAPLRDALMPMGITLMSAGSRTDPGGYTGVTPDSLHLTVRGKFQQPNTPCHQGTHAEGQFEIDDTRSPAEIAETLRNLGLEPVWKDCAVHVL